MSINKQGIKKLFEEFLSDFNLNTEFYYNVIGNSFMVNPIETSISSIDKQGIRNLLNKFLKDYDLNTDFDYNFIGNSFMILANKNIKKYHQKVFVFNNI